MFIGDPRDRSTWKDSDYSFTNERWGEVIHHFDGHQIYEIRLEGADGRVKRVNLHELGSQAREKTISDVLELLDT